MKLYYSPGACSLASHILLNEINVDFDLEQVDLKTHKTEKGADYYEINPKGYVPALEINPGLILTENVAVLPFIAQHDPKQDLIPPSGLGRAKVLEWLGYLNSELHDAYAVFFGSALTEEEKARAYAEIDKILKYIENYLQESEFDYLVNDRFGPADAYLFVITNWSNVIQHDLTPYPNIVALRNKVAERQSVQIAMRDEGLIP
ncbi:glutathione binding-like protein [Acinetobacter gerneri]|uniref:Glutathione binding-like protein n=1 Tax=Acinetobacter gerneri TaxID=202952 RepID=A0AAW8JPB0_9GAMM|nr:glutathione binding-like protein [Acinetobacter gerneri]MDQ9010157.1 glutathione binding-like protein [Acinetobacter gerneri]MDQ9014238.1 glutathione binding-like protein [Acinetobacter gerneri]MDQ9025435.1 glutathione binding-like protein [Acinetobacter gerneri]MDQ9052690.1 glutathione binding-like protein [Acinetobacter gerneri]MDQ9060308.1 glutathione binding-like protein [Acinetobacter gerneri]